MGVTTPLARQRLLQHLATLALHSGAANDHLPEELSRLPRALIDEVLRDIETGAWETDDCRPLLELLAEDPRPAVQRHLARTLERPWPAAPPDWIAPLLGRLADRAHGATRLAVARSLAHYLDAAEPLRRIEVILELAADTSPARRATLARALCWAFPAPLADTALAQLAKDPVPAVRALALVAACCRYHEGTEAYAAILKRLSVDPHPSVRRAGRRAAWGVLPEISRTRLRLV